MRETPELHRARTGRAPPDADVTVAGPLLGTTPRPPREDEPCPTLFRDVGPQALAAFLAGTLTKLEGAGSHCIFLRDATLPGYSACVEQFGVLTFLEPLALGPWVSGQQGIWVAENGRFPEAPRVAAIPAGEDLAALDAKLDSVASRAELREVMGGAEYDERLADSQRALTQYLEDWSQIERVSQPIRVALDGPSSARRDRLLGLLAAAGLQEKDVRAPWFHLAPARRDLLRPLLADLATRLSGGGVLP